MHKNLEYEASDRPPAPIRFIRVQLGPRRQPRARDRRAHDVSLFPLLQGGGWFSQTFGREKCILPRVIFLSITAPGRTAAARMIHFKGNRSPASQRLMASFFHNARCELPRLTSNSKTAPSGRNSDFVVFVKEPCDLFFVTKTRILSPKSIGKNRRKSRKMAHN